MKVIFVLPNVAVGGVERVRLTLIEYLLAHGVQCRLALRYRKGELLDRAESLLKIDELAPDNIAQFVPALTWLIKRERPTHVVTAFSDVGFLTLLAIRRSGVKVRWIHSVHNTHTGAANRPGAWGRVRSWIENRMGAVVYRAADAVVAVSEGVSNELIDLFGMSKDRVRIIYNPVIPDTWFKSLKMRGSDGSLPRRLVTIGRLVPQKGIDVLIRALARVPGDWRLDIWGDGPERGRLESLVAQAHLCGRVAFRGYTSVPKEVLANADVFVMSSRHEGLPATLIEALAAGCQIVATDCPHGPREILEEGVLGELVPVEDESALAAAIGRVLRGDLIVAPEARQRRARDFMQSVSCESWLSLLQSI